LLVSGFADFDSLVEALADPPLPPLEALSPDPPDAPPCALVDDEGDVIPFLPSLP
jgi:hypothetical protein